MHLARLLPTYGWRAVFALTWGNRFHNPFCFRRLHPDAETILLDGRTGTRDGRLLALRAAISKVRPSVVIPGGLADSFEVIRQLKTETSPVRLVWGMPGIHNGVTAFIRAYRGIIDQGFGVSRLTAHLLERVCGLTPERVHYVPTGVAAPTRPAHLSHTGPIRLGYVGRFDDDKRPLDLVPLCEELDRQRVDYRLVAVGHGSLGGALAQALAPWSASGRVQVLPAIPFSDLYARVYPELDACLLFSPTEGMPNSLLEAMAHGLVPVTADFSGRAMEGLIQDGQTGVVFPVADMPQAAARIAQLWREKGLRVRLGQQARQAVEARHGLPRMGDAFATVLESALAGEPANGHVHPVPGAPVGRLSGWFGPTAAEQLRRLFRRHFRHTDDDGEWPRISKIVSEHALGEVRWWMEKEFGLAGGLTEAPTDAARAFPLAVLTLR